MSKVSKPETIFIWSLSKDLYEFWKNNKVGGRHINTKYELNSRSTCNRMVNMFKNNWNPSEDEIWLTHFGE